MGVILQYSKFIRNNVEGCIYDQYDVSAKDGSAGRDEYFQSLPLGSIAKIRPRTLVPNAGWTHDTGTTEFEAQRDIFSISHRHI